VIRWARSATKHRVTKAQSGFVIEHCGLVFRLPPPSGQQDERLIFLGDDQDGLAIEVMAVELEDGDVFVIHAMSLRRKYREQYEEAKRWRI